MSKWINSDVLRGAHMVMQLKEAAMQGGLDNPVSEITGCGVAVVTRFLDALLTDWLEKCSLYADAQRNYELERAETKEWDEIGFDNSPSGYSPERQAELRALAQRWNDEDEAEMDAEDQDKIDKRRAEREARVYIDS